jgi:hypothetical protein
MVEGMREGDLCNQDQKFVSISAPYMVKKVDKMENSKTICIYWEERRKRDTE